MTEGRTIGRRRRRSRTRPWTQSETLAWNLGRDLTARAAEPPPPGTTMSEAVGTWLTPAEGQALDRLGPLEFVRWAQLGWERYGGE
jgi:hypothetical protein